MNDWDARLKHVADLQRLADEERAKADRAWRWCFIFLGIAAGFSMLAVVVRVVALFVT